MPGDEGTWTPRPDPTLLTTEQMERGDKAERDYVDGLFAVLNERLRGIDTATIVLNEIVTRVPTEVQKEVLHLRELVEEKFDSVGTQFKERDTRSERESRDNEIRVNAAFAAADKAADERNKSNGLAIDKAQATTAEAISKLAELFRTSISAQGDKIDDLKDRLSELSDRVGRIESTKAGATEQARKAEVTFGQLLGAVGTVLAVASFVIYLVATSGGPS